MLLSTTRVGHLHAQSQTKVATGLDGLASIANHSPDYECIYPTRRKRGVGVPLS